MSGDHFLFEAFMCVKGNNHTLFLNGRFPIRLSNKSFYIFVVVVTCQVSSTVCIVVLIRPDAQI